MPGACLMQLLSNLLNHNLTLSSHIHLASSHMGLDSQTLETGHSHRVGHSLTDCSKPLRLHLLSKVCLTAFLWVILAEADHQSCLGPCACLPFQTCSARCAEWHFCGAFLWKRIISHGWVSVHASQSGPVQQGVLNRIPADRSCRSRLSVMLGSMCMPLYLDVISKVCLTAFMDRCRSHQSCMTFCACALLKPASANQRDQLARTAAERLSIFEDSDYRCM